MRGDLRVEGVNGQADAALIVGGGSFTPIIPRFLALMDGMALAAPLRASIHFWTVGDERSASR